MVSTTTPTESTTPGIISGGTPGGTIAGSIRLQESITTTPLESHHFSNQLIISSIIVNCCRNLSILLLANAKQVHRPSFLCLNHEAMDLVTFQFILWSHNYSTSSDSR
jgi:hypothetical protein